MARRNRNRPRALLALVLAALGCAGAARAAEPSDSKLLSCSIQRGKPILDWEFRFFARFRAVIPAKQLAGPKNVLRIETVVTPLSTEGVEPVLLRRTLRVAPIPEGTKGRIELDDSFVVGEGRYSVEWRLRDSFGRHCSSEWKIEAKPKRGQRNVKMSLRPGAVDDSLVYLFRPEPAVANPDLGRPLRLKVFLNFDVRRRRRAARVRLWEFMPRIAVLRSLSRHPRLGQFSMVVYSLDEQDVFHRHDLQPYLDFRPLRGALKKLSPATVSLEQLGRDSERDFFGEMLAREISAEGPIDAYVFVGPDGRFGEKLSRAARETLSGVGKPVFFLKTSSRPWRGLVGNAVGVLDGKEYKAWDPKKLSEAVAKLVALLDEQQRQAP